LRWRRITETPTGSRVQGAEQSNEVNSRELIRRLAHLLIGRQSNALLRLSVAQTLFGLFSGQRSSEKENKALVFQVWLAAQLVSQLWQDQNESTDGRGKTTPRRETRRKPRDTPSDLHAQWLAAADGSVKHGVARGPLYYDLKTLALALQELHGRGRATRVCEHRVTAPAETLRVTHTCQASSRPIRSELLTETK
jgi:hypothetical protein